MMSNGQTLDTRHETVEYILKDFRPTDQPHFATKFTVKSFLDPLIEPLIFLKLQRYESLVKRGISLLKIINQNYHKYFPGNSLSSESPAWQVLFPVLYKYSCYSSCLPTAGKFYIMVIVYWIQPQPGQNMPGLFSTFELRKLFISSYCSVGHLSGSGS